MAERFSPRLPTHPYPPPYAFPSTSSSRLDAAQSPLGPGAVVLLTGSTGALGSYLLSSLAENPDVSRVYALNRGSDRSSLLERQRSTLDCRGLDCSILGEGKVVLLEADVSVEGFCLDEGVYKEMHETVTHIIHNGACLIAWLAAWPVNFNYTLDGFESSIRGHQHLIEFALSSPLPLPPRFVFTSAIGVLQNVRSKSPILERRVEAETAVGAGYVESKWVAEEMLHDAASRCDAFDALVVRIGQLCGSRRAIRGVWNEREWIPAMVQSAPAVGCLPTDDKVGRETAIVCQEAYICEQTVAWIPIDDGSEILADLTLSAPVPHTTETPVRTVHLIHADPAPWSSIAPALSDELALPLVPYEQWLAALESLSARCKATSSEATSFGSLEMATLPGAEKHARLRALRLLPFYQGLAGWGGGDAMGFPTLDCSELRRLSPRVGGDGKGIPRLQDADARGWMGYWRSIGLFD
ncbi:NAD(P)-binding protein [Coniophora puteana RWD-64-598 SS2]|uniref:NAD(P)-binding protein n=1 Tax=Coniophora puteana (strain RWD-64-598) TaxID=741705 RepID=A0A5M3MP66_CONPW|nr:NAD(P)-binding protein [Coniophora puteana RWD-64-598 SS2]EIW80431.1 NAD(P)-binding protein [Coniophora puteana RWD-64-598 SS2]